MATLSNLMVRIGVDESRVGRGITRAARQFGRLGDAGDRLGDRLGDSGERSGRNFGEGFLQTFGRALKGMAGGAVMLLKSSAGFAAIGSGLVAAIPLIAHAVPAMISLGSAALAAASAFVALRVAGMLVKASLTAIFAEGTAARKALEPLGTMLNKAAEAGSKAAANGIRPLADALRRVAQPVVTQYMEGVGRAANKVQKTFLAWAKSADGLKTLRGILFPISKMLNGLAPHISNAAIAFARMLGRIMGVSAALGGKGLAGALDWLTKKMNGVNADKVSNGLSKLASAARTAIGAIRTVAGWIGQLVQAYKMYTTEFGLVADAMSVVAIMFGGPIAAAIGGASLIIRHFDQVKAAWERLKGAFSGGGGGGAISDALQQAKAATVPVLTQLKTLFQQVWTAVKPALEGIGKTLRDDVLPAILQFWAAAAPIVQRFLALWGPHLAATFANVLNIVRGALQIIAGVIKVVTGFIKGDWSMVWDGVQMIFRGAWTIIKAVASQAVNAVSGIIKLLIGVVTSVFGRVKSLIPSYVKDAWSAALSAVRAGVSKVGSALGKIKSVVTGALRGAGSWLVSAGRAILDGLVSGIRSAIGKVQSVLNSVTGMIPDWKGPMRVDLKLLEPTGRAIMSGLTSGITAAIPDVRKTLGGVTAAIPEYAAPQGVRRAGSGGGAPVALTIRSGGSQLEDLLVEVLRAAVRDRGGDVQHALGR